MVINYYFVCLVEQIRISFTINCLKETFVVKNRYFNIFTIKISTSPQNIVFVGETILEGSLSNIKIFLRVNNRETPRNTRNVGSMLNSPFKPEPINQLLLRNVLFHY